MKLKFKKQQYQEDASLSVVKCFEGQPKAIRQDLIGRREKKIDLTNWNESSVEDIISFGNNRIMITREDLRKNIRAVQKQNNLEYTDNEGYENYSQEELYKMGINDSCIHVDFMIGSEDLDIKGYTKDGQEIQIFKNGTWAF